MAGVVAHAPVPGPYRRADQTAPLAKARGTPGARVSHEQTTGACPGCQNDARPDTRKRPPPPEGSGGSTTTATSGPTTSSQTGRSPTRAEGSAESADPLPSSLPPPLPLLPSPLRLLRPRRVGAVRPRRAATRRTPRPRERAEHPRHPASHHAYTRRCGSNAAACGPLGSSGSGAPSLRHTRASGSPAGACHE